MLRSLTFFAPLSQRQMAYHAAVFQGHSKTETMGKFFGLVIQFRRGKRQDTISDILVSCIILFLMMAWKPMQKELVCNTGKMWGAMLILRH